jgi:hypothetical protein
MSATLEVSRVDAPYAVAQGSVMLTIAKNVHKWKRIEMGVRKS